MTINLSLPASAGQDLNELRPRITVIGVGGAGCNAVNNMIRLELQGVDFIVANTDAQALRHARAERRIQLGVGITQGLGAGSRPDLGRAAAEETLQTIIEQIKGTHMVFIAAGLGGGTGTGAAPIIAKACRDLGILTVGVVTKPFQFEGPNRMRLADSGLQELEQHVDTLIVIPNQNLFRIANEKTTFADAFAIADDVLYSGVRSVTDLMVMPGLINLDFADVRTVMSEMGKAMMGTGESEGERRALDAAEAAIANPLIDDASMKGARGVLINITGGRDMTLFEVDEAANRIRTEVDEEAHIIFGASYDESLEGRVRVSVVATGIHAAAAVKPIEPRLSILERLQAIRSTAASKPATQVEPAPITIATVTEERIEPMFTSSVAIAIEAPAPVVVEAPMTMAEEAKVEAVMDDEAAELVAPPQGESVAALAEAVLQAAESSTAVALESAAPSPASAAQPRRPLFRDLPRPAAMPQMGALDAFIPIAPAGETRRDTRSEPVAVPAAQVRAPAAASASLQAKASPMSAAAKRAFPSLFDRITSRPSRVEIKAEPPRQPQPSHESVVQSGSSVGSSNPKLMADPADRISTASPEDDLLDIPAFLRRQAN